jgi:hypothetical protein
MLGVPGSCISDLSQCRVTAFGLSGVLELAHFFTTISLPKQLHYLEISNPALTPATHYLPP